ncbi:MAG TPA: alpha-glucan family phosphorylase [Syntrophales bacterium]|nr:alpha-glucan family phosphorylase [Syntrophales bacterium]
MTENNNVRHLFEVSWEVCNKVGGINTVIRTKIPSARKHFGDNYVLIGPDFGNNAEFEETTEDLWPPITEELKKRNLTCRCGRWTVEGHPRVILVGNVCKYPQSELLFQLWQDFGVDSIRGSWDYIEPVLYSTAFGEAVAVLYDRMVGEGGKAVAQFHEWMMGAGLLYVKKHVPEVGTVFTTHATVLGRSLCGNRVDIYSDMESFSPREMAARMNVEAKHSLESITARECDCFTTVSEITAKEAAHFLQRAPQVVLPNGINIDAIPDLTVHRQIFDNRRQKLFEFASTFLQRRLDPRRFRVFLISGRYEFFNKGIDLFLESLGALNRSLKAQGSADEIVALVSVIGGHYGISAEAQQIMRGQDVQRAGITRVSTHQLHDPQRDPIWNKCNAEGLLNGPEDPVSVIFMPVYLDGYDGLLNMPYEEVLSSCDLGVFPSYYEPWGYTPLECAAWAVPTVTTNLAGFGLWVKNHFENGNRGVLILEYQGKSHDNIVKNLTDHMARVLLWPEEERNGQKKKAREIAEKANWKYFYPYYLEAYELADHVTADRRYAYDSSAYGREFAFTGADTTSPRFRSFTVVPEMPEKLGRLWDLARNLWWSWNPRIRGLFEYMDPKIWSRPEGNPVDLLERASLEDIDGLTRDTAFMDLYEKTVAVFDRFMGKRNGEASDDQVFHEACPVAYFSTEFGLHESMPVYSGGLGILSGDHLKTASDLNIPMVGVGLLYKSGYFFQTLDREGNQVALYPENDFSRMPVRTVEKNPGEPLKIHVDLPGRKLYAQAWKVDVGRVRLYLLDTTVPENSKQDQQITSRLYGGDRRLRIEQEIMLGIGGVRLLRALGIRPAVYHLNEGHSAFLLLERIRWLMKEKGLTYYEAREVVKARSVFTTHSPVEAANERFDEGLIKHYFADYVKDLAISWDMFWELGRDVPGENRPFQMTILAFKLSSFANAVSALHGEVARKMWKHVWSGFDETETPILSVTNGVHVPSWIAEPMRNLFEERCGIDFQGGALDDKALWERVAGIPDGALWDAHCRLKEDLTVFLGKKMAVNYEREGLSPRLIRRKIDSLNPEALIIGFGRRFAAYKRASLIFNDPDRLQAILGDEERPVQILFAGKAHPNDGEGNAILKEIYRHTMDERFIDRVFFLENYDMHMARTVVQGVDVWLNNPLRPQEASGTSGMKVVMNGGLNFSILDGWWCEGYDPGTGWAIGEGKEYANREAQDLADSAEIYRILEEEIVPKYYERDGEGLPIHWIKMMKTSISTLSPRFGTQRMLREYLERMYLPAAKRSRRLNADAYAGAKALADWKGKIASRFSTVHILSFQARGLRGDSLNFGQVLRVEAAIALGRLSREEVRAELVVAAVDETNRPVGPEIVPMTFSGAGSREGVARYAGAYQATRAGRFVYGIRVLPSHPDLIRYQELGLVHWG